MDDEQRRRTITAIKRVIEVLHQLSPAAQEAVEQWKRIARRLEEEADHEIDTEVDGFANTLDNMTDKQIWHELEEKE